MNNKNIKSLQNLKYQFEKTYIFQNDIECLIKINDKEKCYSLSDKMLVHDIITLLEYYNNKGIIYDVDWYNYFMNELLEYH